MSLLLNAGEVLDKIIATVNSIPVTSYEVEKLSSDLNISSQKALNYLLDQKLIQSEIKKRGISVDDFEVENAMEKIAKQNGMNLFEFKNILMQKGQLDKLKKRIKQDLLKQKLFEQIVQTKLHVSPDEIKTYYDNHKDEFQVFKTVQVTKYSADNRQTLLQIKQNPLYSSDIKPQTRQYSYTELPLGLLFLFKQTDVNSFTPVINDGLGYSMYFINSKDGNATISFDKVKNGIANKLIAQKREMILKDYFNKLKNKAYIKYFN
jgi:hypothetical protein